MVNRNPRGVGFQERNLSTGGRLPTDLPEVVRNDGSYTAQSAKSLDVFSERLGRYADEAIKVEASNQAQLDAASGNFKPDNGSSLRARAYDAEGGNLYFSKLTAQFDSEAAAISEQYRANPAGLKSAFSKLTETYKRDNVFPEFHAAFDARAIRTETAMTQAALGQFKEAEKDRARSARLQDMSMSSTARIQQIQADPNAEGIEQAVEQSISTDVQRLKDAASNKEISETEATRLILNVQNEARTSLIAARASKLQTANDVEKYRESLKKEFTSGKLKIDGDEFLKLDSGLSGIAKAKGVAFSQATSAFDKKGEDILDRHSKGFSPSVAELAALASEAQMLGPAGAQKMEALHQKINMRSVLSTLTPEQGQSYLSRAKQGVISSGVDAMSLMQKFEGFRSGAYWDVNAHRVGFGSDTITRADGTIEKVTQNSKVTQEDAMRDLARRTKEFEDGARTKLGAEIWNGLPNNARAALVSVAYNYGSIPDRLVPAIRTGDVVKIASAVEGLAGDNAGVNADRRKQEAAIIKDGRAAGAGFSPFSAHLFEDGEKYLKDRMTRLNTDPLDDAQKTGLIPQITPLEWEGQDVKNQLSSRISQADAVAEAQGRAPQYLRPGERDRLRENVEKAGNDALVLLENIVEIGGAKAPLLLKEIETAAPRYAGVGMLMARGTPEHKQAAKDAYRALKMQQEQGMKMPSLPKSAEEIARQELGTVYGENIEKRNRVVNLATSIYQGVMARGEFGVDDPKAEELYKNALSLATGKAGKGERAKGGVEYYKPVGGNGIRQLEIPDDVVAKQFPAVIGSIRDIDLQEAPGSKPKSPITGDQYTSADFKRAFPILNGMGRIMFMVRQQQPDSPPQYIMAENGRPYELDWKWFRSRAIERVPQAF